MTTIQQLNKTSLFQLVTLCNNLNFGISYNSYTQKIEGVTQ